MCVCDSSEDDNILFNKVGQETIRHVRRKFTTHTVIYGCAYTIMVFHMINDNTCPHVDSNLNRQMVGKKVESGTESVGMVRSNAYTNNYVASTTQPTSIRNKLYIKVVNTCTQITAKVLV